LAFSHSGLRTGSLGERSIWTSSDVTGADAIAIL
jgi:hypothetical protein